MASAGDGGISVAGGAFRRRAVEVADSRWLQNSIIAVILLNGVVLGMETYEHVFGHYTDLFRIADRVFVAVFACEMALKVYAHRGRFFADPWNWFDLAIVAIAVVPATGEFSVLRILRVLRLLRLISIVPQMRQIVSALLRAVPGLGVVIGLLFLVMYVSAVLGEQLFEGIAPEYFGDLGTTLYTLFMLLTTENWPDISDAVIDDAPFAWVFFVGFIVVAAFIVLNLIIGVIVTTMEEEFSAERWRDDQEMEAAQHREVIEQLADLRRDMALLHRHLAERTHDPAEPPAPGDPAERAVLD